MPELDLRVAPWAERWVEAARLAVANCDVVATAYALRRAVAADPDNEYLARMYICHLDMLPSCPPCTRVRAREAYDLRFVGPTLGRYHINWQKDRDPERPLKIGYVTSDAWGSSAAMSWGNLIYGADETGDEAILFSADSPKQKALSDEVREGLRASAHRWLDVTGWTDAEIAVEMRRLGIDIAVDLDGWSPTGKLGVFSHKPAPLAVTGWGHATGLDLSSVGYFAADHVAVPRHADMGHTEEILRVPSTISYAPVCRPEIRYRAPSGGEPFRFGYLGRVEKIGLECLAAWSEILHRVPNSRLLLKAGDWERPEVRARALVPLGAYGIPSDRVEFRGVTSHLEHLRTYDEVDLHLDTFPHGGGVTTMDAYWMGCPTVTLEGDTIPGRIGSSILRTIWDVAPEDAVAGGQIGVAKSPEAYVAIARKWARHMRRADQGTLFHERLHRRERMERSVLVDPVRYATAVHREYRRIWNEWLEE